MLSTKSDRGSSYIVSTIRNMADIGISGWVFDVRHPLSPQIIDIFINSVFFLRARCVDLIDIRQIEGIPGGAIAQEWRQNVGENRILAGAFSYEVPEYVPRTHPIKIEVLHSETGERLFDQRAQFDGGATQALTSLLRERGYFRFSAIGLQENDLSVSFVSDRDLGDDISFLDVCHGRNIVDVKKQEPREVPRNWFRFSPDAQFWHYTLRLDLQEWGQGSQVRAANNIGLIGHYSDALFVPDDGYQEYSNWKRPDGFQIERVAGFPQALGYFFDGYATFCVVNKILKMHAGRELNTFGSVLDWGCGVGRLTQHLLRWTKCHVTGIDIDESAVTWCQENLPTGTFIAAPFEPPTSWSDGQFDLIIGISVFTHLDKATQLAWLSELRRLLSDDGVIVVSVNSNVSLYSHPHPIQEYIRLERDGINDDKIGKRLDDILSDERRTYYRETYHASQYLIDVWSQWFDVVAILKGAHFCNQDYVVLRHRSSTNYPAGSGYLEVSSFNDPH